MNGWSSQRGRARHLVQEGAVNRAMCGSIIRFTVLDGFNKDTARRLRQLEVCDHCQDARRKARRK